MKRYILTSIIIALSLSAFSQKNTISRTTIIDAGIATMTNGSTTVDLCQHLNTEEYFVILTPIGSYNELYISKKNNDNFSVYSKNKSNSEFQYIIILKKTKTLLIENEIKATNLNNKEYN